MSLDLLGDGFDLHTGGLDLKFPHHENERAQAVAAGRTFAAHWAHNGMIVDERGEKMSKSLGNTLSLRDDIDSYGPRAFRLHILNSHYRSPVGVGPDSLAGRQAGVERLDAFAREFAGARGAEPDQAALARFRDRMDDDLDTPNAVAIAFDLIREARLEASTAKAAAVFEMFEGALGLELRDEIEQLPEDALALARERDEARAGRDWARADEIRARLQDQGWIVEDGPDGTTIRR
jgi:cysteinyl-tRNA synthetase